MNVRSFCPLRGVCAVFIGCMTAFSAEAPPRPSPPGPHVKKVSSGDLKKTAFRADQPVVGTYYFYWYDDASKAHFMNHDGSDALTRHPKKPKGYSYKRASWHRRELDDILAAGCDFILPVYWGCPGDYQGWSFVGIPPLIEAARQLEKAGKRPPRIGCFYDTSTLRINHVGYHADLTTAKGLDWLYTTVRDFFALVPPDLWATVEGRPIVWLYAAGFARAQNPQALDYVRREFGRDFGVTPYIVKEISWKGTAAATYAWGAALKPTVFGVAAVGPGYDHAAVPGRTPLVKDREGGAFYRRSWEWILARPKAIRPSIAVIETWNEWHEGTDIAPSVESGDFYVKLTREYTDLWHAGKERRPTGPFAVRRTVSVTLGETNTSDGLRQTEVADGKTRPTVHRGKPGRTTVATEHGGRYIYFDIAESFYWGDGVPMVLEITFLDSGTGSFGLDYDSTDRTALHSGAFKAAPNVQKTGGGDWRTVRIRLVDGAFSGRANGFDFRLADHDGTLTVHRVAVEKETERAIK